MRKAASRIEHDDIEAMVGDAAEIALENFAYAVSGGDAKAALVRAPAACGSRHRQRRRRCAALGRHFTQLHRVAAAQGSGGSLEQAAKSLRPRPHFKREPVFIAHCKRWGTTRLSRALPLIQEAVRRSRLRPISRTPSPSGWC